jgi:hypothetical protein
VSAPSDSATDTQTCINDWCNRPRKARGFCKPCYSRGHQAGDFARSEMRPQEIHQRRRNDDVDEIAVQRLIAGDIPEHTTVGEREAAIRHLHATGLSDSQIGARIGVSSSCVFYRRKALGLPANPQQHPRGLR